MSSWLPQGEAENPGLATTRSLWTASSLLPLPSERPTCEKVSFIVSRNKEAKKDSLTGAGNRSEVIRMGKGKSRKIYLCGVRRGTGTQGSVVRPKPHFVSCVTHIIIYLLQAPTVLLLDVLAPTQMDAIDCFPAVPQAQEEHCTPAQFGAWGFSKKQENRFESSQLIKGTKPSASVVCQCTEHLEKKVSITLCFTRRDRPMTR